MGGRDRILETALTLFAERGTEGTTMRELARRAGVNVALAYHHFGSKRDLYRAVLQEMGYLDAIREGPSFAAEMFRGQDPQKVLEAILYGTWALMASGTTFLRLLFLEALKGDEDAKAVLDELREKGVPRLRWLLVETGVAHRKKAPQLARAIYHIVHAVLAESLMSNGLGHQELRRRAREAASVLVPRV